MQLLIWKLPRLYGSVKPGSPDISGNLLASQSCFGYRSAAHHADAVIRVDLLGGLKGLFCFAEGKTLGHNHAENQITSKSPAKPPRSSEGAASKRTRGRGCCRAPLRLRAAIRAKPARIRLQPSSGRTPPEAPGRPWWWGRRRRLRSGSRTGERWPCACRSRSSRAPPAS